VPVPPLLSKTAARRAAVISFWCPFLAVLVTLPPLLALQNQTGGAMRWLRLGIFGIGCLLAFSGFGLGCLAFITTERKHRPNILWRTLFGVVANGLLICVALLCGIAIKTYPEATRTLTYSAKLEAEQRYKTVSAHLRRLQKQLQLAAENQNGETALVADVSLKLVQKQQQLTDDFYASAKPLISKRLLNMEGVENQEELKQRAHLVERMILANSHLEEFATNVVHEYRQELIKKGVLLAGIESGLNTLRTNMHAANQQLRQISSANVQWAQSELVALDFLSTNWGKWSYNADVKKVKFTDNSLAAEYNRRVRQVNEARERIERVQQEVLHQP
jgi:hypothetical protein